MVLETFRGLDLPGALASVRAHLGDDALILRTQTRRDGGVPMVEVVATTPHEIESFRARLERTPTRLTRAAGEARPEIVALVGPSGAGKTTTTVKLALHPAAFGARSVGLITLDTYRVGALEQLQTYAEIANLPLEVVYHPAEVEGALERLAGVDVILVDTPGRSQVAGSGPTSSPEASTAWRTLLRRIGPDEVHLVLPAGVRLEVAHGAREAYAPCGPTHLLLSKLDEVPGDAGVAEIADELGLPARWVATGQEVPLDLHPAPARILAALCREGPTRSRGVAI
jgi:flagellar biosynthesis protein FlhF